MALTDFETIRVEISEGILTITLHRPDRMNAFTGQMMKDMVAAFDIADADDAVRAVSVTGAWIERTRPPRFASSAPNTRPE